MSKRPLPQRPDQFGPRDWNQFDPGAQVKASRLSRRVKRTWKKRRGAA